MNKNLRFEAIVDNNIEKINPLFSKVKIKIAYTGTNRNNSYISKEAFEKALPSIYNCPIIGEFIETVEDFGSHGGKIEISDKGIKYIQTTKPYGLINESSEVTWEDIMDSDGKVNTYLCATGYLWTGRYEELFSVVENSKSQSMEIIVNDGKFEKINNKDVYAISDFTFSGFCILGNDVEPCFEGANIQSYSLDKDNFKLQFAEMLKELKESLNFNNQSSTPEVDNIDFSKEGGNNLVEEKIEIITKYGLTLEQLDFSIDEISLEELEEKLKEFSVQKPEVVVEFSATYRQKRESLQNALDPKVEKDNDGNVVYEEYLWVEDFDDSVVFVEKSIWTPDNYERKYGRFSYTFNEETLTATITGEFEEMVLVWLTIDENQKLQEERNSIETVKNDFAQLQNEFDEYKIKYSTSNEEFEILKEFKTQKLAEERSEQETNLFSLYEEKLKDVEEFETLKINASNYSIEDLEKELALMFVKKTQNFSFNKNEKKVIKIGVSNHEDESIDSYGGLMEKHLNK